ncbi:DUF7882 family protein [Herbiconiux liangxiaofengii]|uniref:DUF7882 family protein n=1 Tax=Herbiconiux liangxiaofengii TaxID=3342795 RepID=UPI0035B9C89D
MGKLTYDSSLTVDFEDRILAHLHLVIGAKLRRSESFFFSWKDDVKSGSGRSTIWIHPSTSLAFKFYGGRPPAINRAWVEALMLSANTPSGLQLVSEPDDVVAAATAGAPAV